MCTLDKCCQKKNPHLLFYEHIYETWQNLKAHNLFHIKANKVQCIFKLLDGKQAH